MTSTCDKAHQHLLATFERDKRAHQMLVFNGQQFLRKTNRFSLLEYLCRAIAGQQLSTKAASTIWGRVKIHHQASDLPFKLFLQRANFDELRSCGLSGVKTKTITGLARADSQGELSARKLKTLDHEDLINHLCQFWGVGQWTAEMCAIGYFKMTDVWSEGDVGLKNAISFLYEGDSEKADKAVSISSPFRSYWSLHLWSALDNGFFKAEQ